MQKAVEINSRGQILRGMAHIPENGQGKMSAVILFHGFTGSKTEPHFILVKMSRLLEKNGIASFRFDFSGSGESDGNFSDMTLSNELSDATNILDYVRQLDYIDRDRIGLLGLSMGGAVAGMLAGSRGQDIKALCLWAPAGNMKELVLERAGEEGINAINKYGFVDFEGNLVGRPFYDDIMVIDIYGKTAVYKKNVLIIHGDGDETVPVSTSYKYLEIFEQRALLHVIEGADHTFNSKLWEDEVLDYSLNYFLDEL